MREFFFLRMSINIYIKKSVDKYYSEKILLYGPTPQGVDWSSVEVQERRFFQLCKILPENNIPFSFIDYGCGYGALWPYLNMNYQVTDYIGYDFSKTMVEAAILLHGDNNILHWQEDLDSNQIADYVIASGIFNVKQEIDEKVWEDYMYECIKKLDIHSKLGFSFNVLTKYSNLEFRREKLFYADPEQVFAFCKKNISENVALLHNYGLYEFTILINKTLN